MPSSVRMADIIAVDHHRRQLHAGRLGQFPGVQLVDEGRLHVLAEGLDHLDDQLRPRGIRLPPWCAWRPAFSHAGLACRRPRASAPMFGAPPKPAIRPNVAVELLPARSIWSVEPMNMSQA